MISKEIKKSMKILTLNDVTSIVIDRRKNIVPPRAKNRRSMILLYNRLVSNKKKEIKFL